MNQTGICIEIQHSEMTDIEAPSYRKGPSFLKRSSSLLKVGRIKHCFRFTLEFETVSPIFGFPKVVITWERKGVVLATQPVSVDHANRSASFHGQKLSQTVTLFKPGKSARQYDPKVYKIFLRAYHITGKVIGRVDLNLATYAAAETVKKRLSIKLSHDGRLIFKCESSFLGVSGSGSTTNTATIKSNDTGSAFEPDPSEVAEIDNMLTSHPDSPLPDGTALLPEPTISADAAGSSSRTEELKKENDRLRRRNRAIIRNNAQLSQQIADQEEVILTFEEENDMLRKKKIELEVNLRRESAYPEVIQELKNAKLTLAAMYIENENLKMEIKTYISRNGSSSRG